MHYHLEIIMPPFLRVEPAVDKILKPFDENYEDEDGYKNNHAFWDWWQIGGRYSGSKLEASLDQEKLKAFREKLHEMEFTFSGLVCGKEELNPTSQIEVVDGLWQKWFPDSGVKQCPFFNHFDEANNMDICRLDEVSPDATAYQVIIAVNKIYDDELAAEFMCLNEVWNGVTWQNTTWDGKVLSAVEKHNDRLSSYKKEALERYTPKDDWLVVTVDYHS